VDGKIQFIYDWATNMIAKKLLAALALLLISGCADAGYSISPDFCGLSFETAMLHPVNGNYFFSAEHTDLISLFQSLGVKSLRIGGNSADNPAVRRPSEEELDHLFAFARAAGVHVIYNLRLKGETDPAADVQVVKYLMSHYKSQITCFTIGNEPNVYFKQYADYRAQWKKFADAILAEVPDAMFNGPSTTPGKTTWSRDFASDFASWGHLQLVTQHAYPGGNARLVADPAAARLKVLAPEMDASYQKFYDNFVPAVFANHEQYRLEESNSLFHGGATGVSNSCASALWALDFMHWWASHGAEGINFHTGNHVVDDETQVPGGYDISYSTPSGLKVHPMGYALKAFSFCREGRYVPFSLGLGDKPHNITYYAVELEHKTTILTIINKESAKDAAETSITIAAPPSYVLYSEIELRFPNDDIANVTGATLGGAAIAGNGSWNGTWNKLGLPVANFKIAKSSAMIISIVPNGTD
jgi:hypothetical protein